MEVTSYKALFDEYDTLAIVRQRDITEHQLQLAIDYMHSQIGKPFDFWFEWSKDALFCTELVVRMHKRAKYDLGLRRLKRHFFRPTVPRADEFLRAKNLDIIFLSKTLVREGRRIVRKLDKKDIVKKG